MARLTVANVIQHANTDHRQGENGYPIAETDDNKETRTALRDTLLEIAGERGGTAINPRILGRWIERHAERRLNGQRLVQEGISHRAKRWMVASDAARQAEKNSPNSPNSPFPGSGGACREKNSPPIHAHAFEQNQPPRDGWQTHRGELGSLGEFLSGQPEARDRGCVQPRGSRSVEVDVEGEL